MLTHANRSFFRREISLQFHRYFLLNQHRDRNQLMVLARQVLLKLLKSSYVSVLVPQYTVTNIFFRCIQMTQDFYSMFGKMF